TTSSSLAVIRCWAPNSLPACATPSGWKFPCEVSSMGPRWRFYRPSSTAYVGTGSNWSRTVRRRLAWRRKPGWTHVCERNVETLACGGGHGPVPEPFPSARSLRSRQSVSSLPPAPDRGSRALGSLSARLGREPLRRRGDGVATLLGRPHTFSRATHRTRPSRAQPHRAGTGAADALHGRALPHQVAGAGSCGFHAFPRGSAPLAHPGHRGRPDRRRP